MYSGTDALKLGDPRTKSSGVDELLAVQGIKLVRETNFGRRWMSSAIKACAIKAGCRQGKFGILPSRQVRLRIL